MSRYVDGDKSIVYHYTSSAGLLGIVDSPMRRVGQPKWMLNRGRLVVLNGSDVRYMNDAQELKYAGQLVAKQLRDRLKTIGDPDVRATVTRAVDTIDNPEMPFGDRHRVFAVCFCSDGDLLSQWRGYAGSQGGYAIGFRRNILALTNTVKVGEWPDNPQGRAGGTLARVEYDDARRVELATGYAELIIQQASGAIDSAYSFPPLFGSMSRFAEHKDPSFKEEKEWRLIFEAVPTAGYSTPVLFRPRADGIVPYLQFVVGSPLSYAVNPHDLNFDEVIADLVVGPGPDLALRTDAAKALLYQNDHNPDVVRVSSVPFKG